MVFHDPAAFQSTLDAAYGDSISHEIRMTFFSSNIRNKLSQSWVSLTFNLWPSLLRR